MSIKCPLFNLGHFVSNNLSDDEDVRREIRQHVHAHEHIDSELLQLFY